VARRGRRVVGYAGLWITPDPAGDQAHVTNVAVEPGERRTGVATELLVALARHAIDRGCVAWTLEVRVSSTGAQELYRRFGFAPAGIRTRYYENTEDAIVMWCHDLATPEYIERLEALACAG
jgi:ribosomal-protein-alanine N-acetyltransferase